MKIILLTGLLALGFKVAISATCTYDQISNRISCIQCHLYYHRSSTGEENFLLDITELERSTFMAVPGPPGLIFIPEDWRVVTGIIPPKHWKSVAEMALDFTQELLAKNVYQ